MCLYSYKWTFVNLFLFSAIEITFYFILLRDIKPCNSKLKTIIIIAICRNFNLFRTIFNGKKTRGSYWKLGGQWFACLSSCFKLAKGNQGNEQKKTTHDERYLPIDRNVKQLTTGKWRDQSLCTVDYIVWSDQMQSGFNQQVRFDTNLLCSYVQTLLSLNVWLPCHVYARFPIGW